MDQLFREIQLSFDRIEKNFREDFRLNREESRLSSKENREELARSLKEFQETFEKGIASFNNLQREKFGSLDERQRQLIENTEKRLEEIRVTVDEKLQKTLNERITQSFQLVTEQLESVQKGLGEMQTLAQDVGGLKRVLSNVKTRGNIGEIQLSMLLEQLLAPEQYEANVRTRKGSDAVVEFAVKLPGRDDGQSFVYLPIDAKFPKEVYEQLQDAYDLGDAKAIETAGKQLETTIKKMAKDISEKYLAPPVTTDFGIMFLPFEGIYAEVIRRSSLMEELQRKYKIVVTGPTTLAAILNSLQMGFRTLAIERHSGEVWRILGAVKAEFENFEGMLQSAQKKITSASGDLEKVLGVRTRAIRKKLRDVDTLSAQEARLILPDINTLDNEEEEEFPETEPGR
ncbi:DNA anti-recombination protein RmuC [Parabacteroides sp. PFB2-12]|nr:DNA anti-recombination protein RmuC [Parabacteroides sp. PM6-13]MDH6391876.1 DNA anti-recombination protein RmuC [Parabacteroides sp. PFB2-12]